MFGILYLQSSYSMLKNAIPLPELVSKAKTYGYDFVALSDHNLHGMVSLFKEAKKHHLKPVLGMHLNVQLDLDDTGFLVFVKNDEGFKNLLQIERLRSMEPLTIDILKTYQKGLIFVTSGADASLTDLIMRDEIDQAYHRIQTYKTIFNDVYLGLSLDTFDLEMKVAPALYVLSEKAKVKLLPLHQTSYLTQDDKDAYEALIKIDNETNSIPQDANYQMMDAKTLRQLFLDYAYVFDTLEAVVRSITFDYQPPMFDMPRYPVPKGQSDTYLASLASVGLRKRLSKNQHAETKAYQDRLTYELSVIHKMGYDDYFLIVYDFVKYAKTHDILVGPGRGSSAGSLVAYCLGITDVDPLQYDLLFERFLNPERITMPDIDLDFPDNKRDEVLQYVKETYGKHHVVSIVTFGTFALRSSIRDIARVMKIDPQRVTGIIQRVVNDKIDDTDEEMMRLLKVSKAIEGLPRHTGTHAAGMILAKQDLTEHIPLQIGINDFYQSEFEASELEALGLLKIDFLGIRNLTVIDDVVKMIHGSGKPFSIHDIPYDDEKTYELLAHADTSGIFQLESMGMRSVLRKLKPNTFEDIVALLALYRPGPMDNIDAYIKRRSGQPFSYIHPDLKPILSSTYGIIVYQEQIMRIAHEFAGYTLAEADLLRRGISKKNKDILDAERTRFIRKCQEKAYDMTTAEKIYDYIVKFADYGFNRSHSVAYGIVAYQMAYLKANHFAYFMTVLMSSVIGNEGLTKDYVIEVKRQGIRIMPPDINQSTDRYQLINNTIYMPLQAVKSIGRLTVDKLIEERTVNGPYVDFQNFKIRMKSHLNDKNIEMLIHSGALDVFGINHPTMIHHHQVAHAGYEQYITDFKMQMHDDYTFLEKVDFEKEALGINLVYHPLYAYQDMIKARKLNTLSQIDQKREINCLAMIKKMRTIKTKQGKQMAFLALDDGQTELEATLFTDRYLQYQNLLDEDVLIFGLKKDTYRDKTSYVITTIESVKTKT